MVNLFRLSSIGMFSLVLAMNSCQKPASDLVPEKGSARFGVEVDAKTSPDLEDLTLKGDFEARNGILHFKNLSTFLATEKKLQNLNSVQVDSLLNQPGFESMKNAVEQAYASLQDLTDNTSIEQAVLSNKKLLRIVGKQIVGKTTYLHDAVANSEGMVFIGKTLYRFTEDKQIIVFDGDIDKARKALDTGFKDSKVKVFSNQIESNNKGGRVASTCQQVNKDKYSPDGKRRTNIIVKFFANRYATDYGTGNSIYYVSHQVVTEGTPFKVSGSYSFNYQSDNHLNNAYRIYYSSYFNNYTLTNYEMSSPGEIYNYDYNISNIRYLYSVSNVSEQDLPLYTTNITTMIEGYSYFPGYYYSTGVPAHLDINCDN